MRLVLTVVQVAASSASIAIGHTSVSSVHIASGKGGMIETDSIGLIVTQGSHHTSPESTNER